MDSLAIAAPPPLASGAFHEVSIESFPEMLPDWRIKDGAANMPEPVAEDMDAVANLEHETLRVLNDEEFASDPVPDAVEASESDLAPVWILQNAGGS